MRILKFFGAVALLISLASAAQAATIDLVGNPTGAGVLASNASLASLTLSSMPSYSRLALNFTFDPAALGAAVSTTYNGITSTAVYVPSPLVSVTPVALAGGVSGLLSISSTGASLIVSNFTHGLYTFQNDLLVLFSNFAGSRILYDYTLTAVPLPAVLPLFAVGVLGLGVAKKRRKA